MGEDIISYFKSMADALLTKILKEEPIDWAGGFDLQAMNERREQYIQALRVADSGDILNHS